MIWYTVPISCSTASDMNSTFFMSQVMKKVEFMSEAVEHDIGTVYQIIGVDRIKDKSQLEKLLIKVYHSGDYEKYLQGETLQPRHVISIDYKLIPLADTYKGRIHAAIFCPIAPPGEESNPKYAEFTGPEYLRKIEEIALEEINDTVQYFAEEYDNLNQKEEWW
jgi:hypothetical protein